MPIFYDIEPSDVRKQNGKYGESLDKHERENKHKVESWRKVLVQAGNLSGWVPKDFANGWCAHGWNMGGWGGGKTTLACAAYTEISHQFQAHCLVENIRDESRKHGFKRMQ
ncbi:hypothetical protein L1987_30048 [Smallanthus sonchifolius]|uniref:Uncharacterized protein n=1 Tax=Smallanthus sonchifolius TaxID=185202 RepID=A0ACB9I1R3_9ASTR|nr:hypothetical protein L1987_30048 [Smallanthus sonchifolius]